MGRHSLPDPDDEPRGDDSAPEPFFSAPAGGAGTARRGRHARPDPDDEWDPAESVPGEEPPVGFEAGPAPQTPAPARAERPADPGEWTGSHRAVDAGRRGVSPAVVVALVAVVVVVAGVIVWQFFGDALSKRSDVAAARCVAGEITVAVAADPSIAGPVGTLAQRYNESADPVGDKCVQVAVTPADSGQVLDGFGGRWPADLGGKPALWIPASTVSAARLEALAGAQTVDDARPLVQTPVLLAVRPELKPALGGRGWGDLPELQQDPAGMERLGLPGWGTLRLALPMTGDADATPLAAEAVAVAAAPPGQPATAGLGAVARLMSGRPALADDTGDAALDALADAAGPDGPVHAVVTTEQRLFRWAADRSDAADVVAAWLPSGPAAVADFPTVLLNGDWLEREQITAASEFSRFMRKPEQLAELAAAGFRVEGAAPPESPVVDFPALAAPPAVGDDAVRVTLADAVSAPRANAAVTLMLDRSMPEQEGAGTRLGNVVGALAEQIGLLPPSAAVGLWTFDGVAGRSEITLGPLADPVGESSRAEALRRSLEDQAPASGGAVSFTTLRLVYTDATANYRDGQANSVLVITAGPHTDRTLDGPGLQEFIRQTFDPARPIAVNVIDFGDDADRPVWEEVARITGGSYRNLPGSDSPELIAAITAALG